MNVKGMIFDIVCEKMGKDATFSKEVCKGIDAYVEEKGLVDFINAVPTEMQETALKMYLQPITDLSANQIVEFFSCYISNSEFDKISKKAFNFAYRRLKGEAVKRNDVMMLEIELNNVLSSLPDAYLNDEAFREKVSEALLDIIFAMDDSRCMSKRLCLRV